MSSCLVRGPFSQRKRLKEWVLPPCEASPYSGSPIALTMAISTGMYSGRQPAITPFTAIFHGVARRFAAGRTAISSSGERSVYLRKLSTLSMVGGDRESPSDQPLSIKNVFISSSVPLKTMSLGLAPFSASNSSFSDGLVKASTIWGKVTFSIKQERKDMDKLEKGNALKAVGKTDEELRVANYIVLFGGRDLEGIASHHKN